MAVKFQAFRRAPDSKNSWIALVTSEEVLGVLEQICHFTFKVNKMNISGLSMYLVFGFEKFSLCLDHRCLLILLEFLFAGCLNKFELLNDLVTHKALDSGVPYVLNYPQEVLSRPQVVEEFEWVGPSMLFEEVD